MQGSFTISKKETKLGERFVVGANAASVAVGTDETGLIVQNVDLAIILERDSLGEIGVAMIAEGSVALNGLGGDLSFSAASGLIAVNTLGRVVDETIDVGGVPLKLAFESGRQVQTVVVDNLSLSVAGGPILSGDARVTSRTVSVAGTSRRQLEIGFEDLSVSEIEMGDASATLSDARGAVLVFADGSGATKYAVEAQGSIALAGLSALSVSADNMSLSLNRTGLAIATQVETATGFIAVDQRLKMSFDSQVRLVLRSMGSLRCRVRYF